MATKVARVEAVVEVAAADASDRQQTADSRQQTADYRVSLVLVVTNRLNLESVAKYPDRSSL